MLVELLYTIGFWKQVRYSWYVYDRNRSIDNARRKQQRRREKDADDADDGGAGGDTGHASASNAVPDVAPSDDEKPDADLDEHRSMCPFTCVCVLLLLLLLHIVFVVGVFFLNCPPIFHSSLFCYHSHCLFALSFFSSSFVVAQVCFVVVIFMRRVEEIAQRKSRHKMIMALSMSSLSLKLGHVCWLCVN